MQTVWDDNPWLPLRCFGPGPDTKHILERAINRYLRRSRSKCNVEKTELFFG